MKSGPCNEHMEYETKPDYRTRDERIQDEFVMLRRRIDDNASAIRQIEAALQKLTEWLDRWTETTERR